MHPARIHPAMHTDGAAGTLPTCAARGPTEAERCFVAYAAHELRGEITLQLALAEATLDDPNADTGALRQMGRGIVAACERQDRLLEALLTLARSEYGRLQREPVDLAAVATRVLRSVDPRALTVEMRLAQAWTAGDPRLVERLVANLVENAVRHNIRRGRLDVATHTAAGHAIFTIANTGPVIPTAELTRLFQPFERLSSHPDGVGLGLALVREIASAHDATLTAEARTGGGLRIKIDFPTTTGPPVVL